MRLLEPIDFNLNLEETSFFLFRIQECSVISWDLEVLNSGLIFPLRLWLTSGVAGMVI